MKRFGSTAALLGAHQASRERATRERLSRLLDPRGSERALDVATGAGALAIALAPLVAGVVGVDIVPELLGEARRRSPSGVEYVEADAAALPFPAEAFDLVVTARSLHHLARPEQALGEMERVLRRGGTMLVVDQLAPADPAEAEALGRFERARDPSTTRILGDRELRGLLAARGLELRAAEFEREERELEGYLDLAGCRGRARRRAAALAPAPLEAEVGWYVLDKPRAEDERDAGSRSTAERPHGTR